MGDINSLLRGAEISRVSYIPWKGNSPANYMAKGGLMCDNMQFTISNLPSKLLKVVLEDAQWCFNVRRIQ